MSEIQRIGDQLQRSFEGPAWYGAAVLEVLDGIGAATAAAPAPAGTHSIWEIVGHMIAWQRTVLGWLEGRHAPPSEAENWPVVADASETAWQHTLQQLRDTRWQLAASVARFDESRLDEPVPDQKFSYYVALHGILQHDISHSAQIGLLKKIAGARQ